MALYVERTCWSDEERRAIRLELVYPSGFGQELRDTTSITGRRQFIEE